MSTRSSIGILNADGTVEAVYCHYDGYPSHNGKILLEHWKSEQQVRNLIENGSMRILGESMSQCSFFHTDNNEPWEHCKPEVYRGTGEFMEKTQCYAYLFNPATGKWVWRYKYEDGPKVMHQLTRAVIDASEESD